MGLTKKKKKPHNMGNTIFLKKIYIWVTLYIIYMSNLLVKLGGPHESGQFKYTTPSGPFYNR